MRKFFVKIATMVLVGVLCLTSLFGCKLITTNTERDMKQVVATIKIDDAPMKTISKREVVIAYNNYVESGYTSTSSSELFSEVIESLIQNAVLVQYAMKHFADKADFNGTKWELESYLDEDEILDCKYNAYLQFEEVIDGYVKDKEEEKVGDTYSGDVRTVPTGATVNSEISDERKELYIENFWSEVITPKYNAYVKTINTLKANDLLGDYEYGKIETIEYFNQILTVYEEDVLIGKFQDDIEKEARKTITFEKINQEYLELYGEQKNASTSEFEAVLSNASAESPVLSGQNGYGMVYHILLKADETMTNQLTELKEKYKKDNGTPVYANSVYRADRAEIFKSITAKDQRESWIKSKYDFGETTTALKGYELAFTGDYTLYGEQSLPFFGKVTHLNDEEKNNDDYRAKYRVDEVETFSISQVLEIINEYLYNGSADVSQVNDRKVYTATDIADDYDKRVKELMFTFSQDDSDTALNTYKGYTIKPQPDGTEKEEWMLEFAEVARNLIKEDEKTFMLVATDYGYHIMFFSEYFGGYSYPTLESYLNKEFKFSNADITTWEEEFNYMVENYKDYKNTDNYLYVLFNELASTYVENAYQTATQEIYADYANNSRVVVKYKDAYKDLVED